MIGISLSLPGVAALNKGVGVRISGTERVGQTLTASNGPWVSYQWWRADPVSVGGDPVYYNGQLVFLNAEAIAGATASTYSLTNAEAGLVLWVVATTNAGRVAQSSATGPVMVEIISRFTVAPDADTAAKMNKLARSLFNAGVWENLDMLKVRAAHDSQAARQNWLQNAYNDTVVGSPVFTAFRGYQGDGTSAYLSSGFIPSSASSPKYQLNTATYGFWSLTSAASSGTSNVDMGTTNTASPRATLRARTSGDLMGVTINDATLGSVANTDGSGFFAALRTGATARQVRRNKAVIFSDATLSTGLPTNSFSTLAGGTDVNRSSRQIALSFIGALSAAQADSLYDAAYEYLLAVGAV